MVIVRPGDKVPVDGMVVAAGHSDVNEAPITGESLPVDKGPGDEVYAGTINGRGALEVAVTRVGRDTRLARIIHLVEDGAGPPRAGAVVRRSLRAHLHAGGDRAGARRGHRAAARWARRRPTWIYRALVLLVDRLPVRAGHLDAGVDRVGALGGGHATAC